ncbi:Monosaccharide-transporting ATPase [Caldicellulosiruptor saccharolyticus DSM 8903]|uniref:Monosaccharide-transporting ATPase n=1 Tax=Caldicellulosiruptor saccharolyticus (strain ATCC 43494 / DSM 8903 / Tp8T 6331) TaxID=351627 RepID=A4XGJ8_CALS8|nr:ABC transporter permease [Caldicellulosiruptor saccharolyticus]ABP66033.1 Monosaccharide-transporting ATPase [Caldicellulosiruptor saccharolyticus DSM 8903]
MNASEQVNKQRRNLWLVSQESLLVYITLIFFLIFSVVAKGFFTLENILTILRSMSIITVLGIGISFVITAGEIDLSISAVPALSGAVLAILLEKGFNIILALLAAIVIAIICGLVNGIIVANTGLPSIIVTLATSMIASGITYIVTKQAPIVITNQGFLNIFGGNIFGFPVMVLWMLLASIIGYILLHKTKIGRNIAFIGENKVASYYAGIKVDIVLVSAFVVCALYSWLGGMLGVAQASNAAPWMLSNDMMTAIAATIIGGTSFTGGKGNIGGTIIGAFFLTMLSNGFLIFGIEQWVLYLVNGTVILIALTAQYLRRK